VALGRLRERRCSASPPHVDRQLTRDSQHQVVKTLIIFGGLLAVERFAPHMYYRLVAVIAYALSIVFWLSGWAWCASWAAAYLSVADYYGFGNTLGYDNWAKKEGGALAGCAGLGAVAW
jgi:membrane protein implicated in regulation of membrane protease activity